MEVREQEKQINHILKKYLPTIEKNNSILKGNLLGEDEKKFVVNNPNAFIIGLISDQSVKAELAWSLPYNLYKRLNIFDFDYIVNNLTINDIEILIKGKPALHRYPNRMATFIYEAMKKIIVDYDGSATNIWKNESAEIIIQRLEEFKGISHKKASLGTLLLIRDLDIKILNKQAIDIAYDVHIRRIFSRIGLVEKDTQENVLSSARRINPEFPGELTTSFWTIGRNYCFATKPNCDSCPLKECCKTALNSKKGVGV
jgi:uncharacterized HhH-GPD family protein